MYVDWFVYIYIYIMEAKVLAIWFKASWTSFQKEIVCEKMNNTTVGENELSELMMISMKDVYLPIAETISD